MSSKTKKKLRVGVYLRAGENLARMGDGQSAFTCLLIAGEALRERHPDANFCDEVRFHERVHGVGCRSIAGQLDPDAVRHRLSRCPSPRALQQSFRLFRQIREVRLMALALTYTLAREHNAGRFRL